MKLLKAISEVISRKLILEISEKRILELINKYQNEKPDLSSDFIKGNDDVISGLHEIQFLRDKLKSDLNKIIMGVFENLYFLY